MDHRTGSPLIGEPSPRATAIRDDIAQTRAEMSRTVGAIEERLSPAHIKEQIADVKENLLDQINDAKDNLKADLKNEIREAKSAVRDATVGRVENMVSDVRDTVSETGTSIVDTIRENPVPAALVAVGLGWLLMSGGSSRRVRRERRLVTGYDQDYRYAYERNRSRGVRRALEKAEARVADVGQKAKEGASHLADEAGAVVHDVGERAAHLANDAAMTGRRVIRDASTSARRYEASLESTMRDNPLVVGAIAVAVGAAIGLALPSTEKEDELLGEAKDRLLEGAKSVAGEALHQVEAKVDEIAAPPPTSQNGHNGPNTARNGLGNGVGPGHV